jgi:hypothetical protein
MCRNPQVRTSLAYSSGVWLTTTVWLSQKGQHDKAKRALRRLIGNVKGYDVEHEYAVLLAELKTSNEVALKYGTSDWAALFKWGNFRRLLAATIPYTFQQFSGGPYLFGYTTYFFQIAGLADPFLGSTIVYVILMLSIIVSFYLVEKVGRRTLVLWGGIVMAIANLVVGSLGFATLNQSALGAALISVCAVWIAAYAVSIAPVGESGIALGQRLWVDKSRLDLHRRSLITQTQSQDRIFGRHRPNRSGNCFREYLIQAVQLTIRVTPFL